MQRASAMAGKAGDASAMATPLRKASLRGQGIKGVKIWKGLNHNKSIKCVKKIKNLKNYGNEYSL